MDLTLWFFPGQETTHTSYVPKTKGHNGWSNKRGTLSRTSSSVAVEPHHETTLKIRPPSDIRPHFDCHMGGLNCEVPPYCTFLSVKTKVGSCTGRIWYVTVYESSQSGDSSILTMSCTTFNFPWSFNMQCTTFNFTWSFYMPCTTFNFAFSFYMSTTFNFTLSFTCHVLHSILHFLLHVMYCIQFYTFFYMSCTAFNFARSVYMSVQNSILHDAFTCRVLHSMLCGQNAVNTWLTS